MATIRQWQQLFVHDWMKLTVPVGVLVMTLVVAYAAKRVLGRLLNAWAARTKSPAGLLAVQALMGPFMIWALILGIHFAMQYSELPATWTRTSGRVLLVLWILSFTMVATRLAADVIRHYGSATQAVLPVTTLTQNLVQIGIVLLSLTVVLNAFDVAITPILTFLGVGGLAVALALQDTLSNLFAGFYVAVAGQVRIGDYIRLNTGEEGYVDDITWRSTTIRSLGNNLIIVPNAKLGQAIVTNFNLPEKRLSVGIQVVVSYECNPEDAERLLLEVASKAVAEVPGLLEEPQPSVSSEPGFGDSGFGMTLNCHVAEFVNQYGVRHALRKRILQRFKEAGVAIASPTRTVYVRERSG
jgi:small-conductance mechanosensitive channel